MTFKPAIWYPIAVVASVVNLLGAGFAIGRTEHSHAAVHLVLALAFGVWAHRLRGRRQGPDGEAGSRLDTLEGLEALQAEVSNLRRELNETQERLDFTERMLAQRSESRKST